jgi:hypothetical protein
MIQIAGILIRTVIIPRASNPGITDSQNTITRHMAEFTILKNINFAKGITVSNDTFPARVTTFASTLKRLSFAMARPIKNLTLIDIISGGITSKAAGFHGFGTMPAAGFVFKGITAVVSGDADFGSTLKYRNPIKNSSLDPVHNLSTPHRMLRLRSSLLVLPAMILCR